MRVGRGRAPLSLQKGLKKGLKIGLKIGLKKSTHRTSKAHSGARQQSQGGAIDIAWVGVKAFLPDRAVRHAVEVARAHGKRLDLAASIVFVTDRALAKLHAVALGDPTRTDVITFDLSDDVGGPLVEIYVSAERARGVARRRHVRVERELSLYVVHGVLHVCGFDDSRPADRARMRRAEATVLKHLGFAPDLAPHDE
ncbi:MAG: rRNA maturation RNase YbeY [Planctomycetota bacterium]|nr:rRNA maturation RNase YbeY [Planctomycetota bacterium]